MVILDMVLCSEEYPGLNEENHRKTPNDQIIFSWAEVAQSILCGPFLEKNATLHSRYSHLSCEIRDQGAKKV